MHYILLLIAFATVVVGVLGKTHDDKVTGVKGIRPLGWIVVLFGLIVLFVSGYTSYRQDKELEASRMEKRKRESVAAQQLLKALDLTFEGINVLYREHTAGSSFSTLKDLTDPAFLNFLEKFDALSPVRDPNYADSEGQPIATLAAQLTNRRLDEFELRLDSFADVLPVDLVKAAHDFHDDREFKVFSDSALPVELNRGLQKQGKHLPYFIIDADHDELRTYYEILYTSFIAKAEGLRATLDKLIASQQNIEVETK